MAQYNFKAGVVYQGDLIVTEERRNYNTESGWLYEYTYRAEQSVIQNYINNRASLLPDAKTVNVTKSSGPFWEMVVSYGIYLHSTWALDSAMHEVPLIASAMGQELDFAFPGWGRFIEIKIDEHFSTESAAYAFDYTKIQSSNLKESDGTTDASFNLERNRLTDLDVIAVNYAKSYIMGTEAFFEPRWIIRNEVTVSPSFNFSHYPILYSNVNEMLNPFWMAAEAILPGEIIPAGIIVPGVQWWYKQPFKKQQTNQNLFVVSREWWGLNHFNPYLYKSKT